MCLPIKGKEGLEGPGFKLIKEARDEKE